MTRQRTLERSPLVAQVAPLLAATMPYIAHSQIRNRGTLGGSLALADPAAEYPACAVALEAVFVLKSKTAERRVKAEQFFKGLFETDLKPGELLVAAEFPVAKSGDRSVFHELTRRHGDYAIIGLARHNARFAFLGAGDRPVLFSFDRNLEGAKETLRTDLKPGSDLYNSSATKLHLAGILLERAWNA
jgi:carbon-monoxide dehydrogenase medium subunit